jgi:hypothetical protein
MEGAWLTPRSDLTRNAAAVGGMMPQSFNRWKNPLFPSPFRGCFDAGFTDMSNSGAMLGS